MSPENRTRVEIQNRHNRAWAGFHKHKKVILNRHVSLAKRLKFFDMCVSPAVLFALVSFPLTRGQVESLDILQRKMLRSIVGWRRIDGEPWDETMRRMRDRIESGHQLHKWQLWSHRFFRDQWRFAVHLLAKMSQWMITYNCSPCFDERGMYVPHRDVGRPRIKWDDHIKAFFHYSFPERMDEHWSSILSDHVGCGKNFVDFCKGQRSDRAQRRGPQANTV